MEGDLPGKRASLYTRTPGQCAQRGNSSACGVISHVEGFVAQSGPFFTSTVRLHAFNGYVLGFVGVVLTLRALIRLFARSRW